LTLPHWNVAEEHEHILESYMSDNQSQKSTGSSKLMQYGMMACCAVMLFPVAAFFIAGGTIAGLWGNVGLFAPLALCLGAHVVMHRMMGKSCHGSRVEQANEATVDAGFEDGQAPERELVRAR
jgi:hypothetical protein